MDMRNWKYYSSDASHCYSQAMWWLNTTLNSPKVTRAYPRSQAEYWQQQAALSSLAARQIAEIE